MAYLEIPSSGRLAQLVEQFVYTEKVRGSSPLAPTNKNRSLRSGFYLWALSKQPVLLAEGHAPQEYFHFYSRSRSLKIRSVAQRYEKRLFPAATNREPRPAVLSRILAQRRILLSSCGTSPGFPFLMTSDRVPHHPNKKHFRRGVFCCIKLLLCYFT